MKKNILHAVIILLLFSCGKDRQDNIKSLIADAGTDYMITLPRDSLTLKAGFASDLINYHWRQIAGPDSFVVIVNENTATADVKNLGYFSSEPGTNSSADYQFELTITTLQGISKKDTVGVNVTIDGCSAGQLNWKLSDNGLMYLKQPYAIIGENFSACGAGLEEHWQDYYYYLKPYPGSGWIKLDYIPEKNKLIATSNVFSSSYVFLDNDQPLYYPAIYANQNAGIDFSKKAIAVAAWR